ncbi:hypothetical protein B0H17DRAFT_1201175 [Mycena rosella]|uniref:Uncharacterized protein n=1 Tax=Mycena rosella TaxID=1033263 RepID=A0AAD7DIY8_MYCRO|nr:hypothetical protein B0H17DRAFT_1201175 [Mycena rosella]
MPLERDLAGARCPAWGMAMGGCVNDARTAPSDAVGISPPLKSPRDDIHPARDSQHAENDNEHGGRRTGGPVHIGRTPNEVAEIKFNRLHSVEFPALRCAAAIHTLRARGPASDKGAGPDTERREW